MVPSTVPTRQPFRFLLIAFGIQVLGRLVDLWWHATHEGFESGGDQVKAHWLMWLGTILVLGVCLVSVRTDGSEHERRGYWAAIIGNLVYIPISAIHFNQHLNHEEVDWAHIGLAITNVVAYAGVVVVIAARKSRPRKMLVDV